MMPWISAGKQKVSRRSAAADDLRVRPRLAASNAVAELATGTRLLSSGHVGTASRADPGRKADLIGRDLTA